MIRVNSRRLVNSMHNKLTNSQNKMNTVEINKQMKLTEHFTLGEMTKTSHKTADGNIPSRVAIENLKRFLSLSTLPIALGK